MADNFRIGLDEPVSAFDICQAHLQLESDYNRGGWIHERPSNRRRKESTGCQLARMVFSPGMRWVEIYPEFVDENEDPGDDAVRQIYMRNVLNWKLPIAALEKEFMRTYWAPDFLASYPWVLEPGDYRGGA